MYQHYWGLRESPFRGGLDPTWFRSTANHDESLARMNFLVDERRRLGLLSGPAGVGKTLLAEVFGQQIADTGGEVVRVNLLGADSQEFLWTVAAQCGLNPAWSAAPFALWRRVADHMIANRYQRKQSLLLLDDAGEAERAVFDLILRLAQIDPHAESRLTIILIATDKTLGQLPVRLLELAELSIRLEPWEYEDTAAYLERALKQAGRDAPLFTAEAIGRLQLISGGIPLRIKQLADLALMAGAGLELAQIDADTIEGAAEELGVVVV